MGNIRPNADHIRLLDSDDFTKRIVPYLYAGGFLSQDTWDDIQENERELLRIAAPLAQSRMQVLSQAKSLLGFLFIPDEKVEYQEKPLRKLKDNATAVLAAAIEVIKALPEGEVGQVGTIGDSQTVKDAMSKVMVEEMGLKPRIAFQPLFVAITGSNVSNSGVRFDWDTRKRLHR